MNQKLIDIARLYPDEDEFRRLNLPNYLLCRKKRLLSIAFPKALVVPKRKGILLLKFASEVLSITIEDDLDNAIATIRTNCPRADRYRAYHITSTADRLLTHLYFTLRYKPTLNPLLTVDNLNIHIPSIASIIGVPTKGRL